MQRAGEGSIIDVNASSNKSQLALESMYIVVGFEIINFEAFLKECVVFNAIWPIPHINLISLIVT